MVSTRVGGVSRGPFASLNLGVSSGDLPENVAANRARFAAAAGLPGEQLALYQVHGSRVVVVGEEPVPEAEDRDGWRFLGRGDALATVLPGRALVVLVADCAPVFVYGPPAAGRGGGASAALAVAHAGWRGTVGGVVGAAVTAVGELAGIPARAMRAVVGPHVGPCCYEVDEAVVGHLARVLPRWRETVAGSGPRYRLDLGLAVALLLEDAGLDPGCVAVCTWCTSCRRDLFYSYRGEGPRTGRMAAAGWLA